MNTKDDRVIHMLKQQEQERRELTNELLQVIEDYKQTQLAINVFRNALWDAGATSLGNMLTHFAIEKKDFYFYGVSGNQIRHLDVLKAIGMQDTTDLVDALRRGIRVDFMANIPQRKIEGGEQ
jgi:hypothetical protein